MLSVVKNFLNTNEFEETEYISFMFPSDSNSRSNELDASFSRSSISSISRKAYHNKSDTVPLLAPLRDNEEILRIDFIRKRGTMVNLYISSISDVIKLQQLKSDNLYRNAI